MKFFRLIYEYLEYFTDLKRPFNIVLLFLDILILFIGIMRIVFLHDLTGIHSIIVFFIGFLLHIFDFSIYKRSKIRKINMDEYVKSLDELDDYLKKIIEEFKENDDDTGED